MTLPSNTAQVDGQGTVSASNYNTYLQFCDTVADLRNFIGLGGMTVYLQGTVTVSDGGQGLFYWNASGTGPDNNGTTYVVPTGATTGCWQRIQPAITNATTPSVSSGTGTVKMSSTNSSNNSTWLPIALNGTVYWLPAWTTNSP